MNRRWISMLFLAALVAVAGCGAPTPAADAVPALATRLARVDAALADGDYTNARQALDALTRETTTARDTDKITAEQAQRILAAVARLTTDLPAPASAPRPTVTVTVQAPPSQSTEADDEGDDAQDEPTNKTENEPQGKDRNGKGKGDKNENKKKKD